MVIASKENGNWVGPSGDTHPQTQRYLLRVSSGVSVCRICKKEKPIELFVTLKGKYQNTCRPCGVIETRKRQEKHAERFRRIKSERGCLRCGENDPYCLDFHHKDPSQKKFILAKRGSRPLTQEVLDEMEKCVVLCANCHAKLHVGRFTLKEIEEQKHD
jgi:peptide methionine sulfoxide reductase MsrB